MNNDTDLQSGKELVDAADEARSKLLRTVERLDARGHAAIDIPKQVLAYLKSHKIGRVPLAVAGICVTALAAYEIVAQVRRRRRTRFDLMKDVWRHPDRRLRVDRPLGIEVARSVLVSVVASALAAPLRGWILERPVV
jgi:hypothetical protein